jgi:hypothetical protein
VLVREIHISHRKIDADSPQEAIDKVGDGGGVEVQCQYSDVCDVNEWTVEDPNGQSYGYDEKDELVKN